MSAIAITTNAMPTAATATVVGRLSNFKKVDIELGKYAHHQMMAAATGALPWNPNQGSAADKHRHAKDLLKAAGVCDPVGSGEKRNPCHGKHSSQHTPGLAGCQTGFGVWNAWRSFAAKSVTCFFLG